MTSLNKNVWPEFGLEVLRSCPVCHADISNAKPKFSNTLRDKIYNAPGKWYFFGCGNCHSVYLNPRPNKTYSSLAYENYYTHQKTEQRKAYNQLNIIKKYRRLLVNGYTNNKYSTTDLPAAKHGAVVVALLLPLKLILDREYRNLMRPRKNETLLDVGCGGLFFLQKALSIGYEVVGLDTDPVVIKNGRDAGIKMVQGDLSTPELKFQSFDVITMSHVIEHLPDPSNALELCYRLLKPGGRIWIETPNINGFGSLFYKSNWRGLEPPRHLIIFNRMSLIELMLKSGYGSIKDHLRPNPTSEIFKASFFIKNDRQPGLLVDIIIYIISLFISCISIINKNRREYITISAQKPIK